MWENSYIEFIKLEELIEYNDEYEIAKWFPNCFCFGGDGGGAQFCYNFITKEYFAIDGCVIDINDNYCRALSLYDFIKAWDKKLGDV